MKNRISMALKDPILQQGFEIICKNLTEYEKENAELKGRNAELKGMYAHSAREAETYKQFLESKEKENAELKADNDARKFAMAMSDKVEKQLREENAELKSIADFQQSGNMSRYFELKRQGEQLTKAIDFLKGVVEVFVTAPIQFSERQKKDLLEDIEQFLNSEVEK